MSALVSVVIPPLPQAYTYSLAEPLAKLVGVGFCVSVPLGNRSTKGFVVDRDVRLPAEARGVTLKEVEASTWNFPHFTLSQLKFFQWIADYYGYPLASVIDVAVPPPALPRFERWLSLTANDASSDRKGQQRIIELVKQAGGRCNYRAVLQQMRGATPSIKGLIERGILLLEKHEVLDQHLSSAEAPAWAKDDVTLNQAQREALSAINEAVHQKSFTPFLLHGVTGSGKTEVYIDAIKQARADGKGALVIVPEIALTPQLIDRFRARLGNEIAVLHSALQPRARWDSWRALIERRNFVAIGARSAVFAPVPDLGLIIVDEEHDSSYKQSEGLRYNARDLALVRGKLDSCPVVLGSATPSLESYHHALQQKYQTLSLPARHGSSAPLQIDLVDLNKVKPWEMPSKNISPMLADALQETLSRNEQAFILYNRRGFSSYLQCEKCEQVMECPNCSVTLTYHQHEHRLLCHYCNLNIVPSEFCPHCMAKKTAEDGQTSGTLVHRGAGTEKIFEEIQALYPETAIARLDRDAASDLDTYRSILDNVRNGTTKILVGTQMIAKGHDLPDVTLVGIADCDVGLHMPDFRAGERVFQLLTQASGRSGRAEKAGRVILQTRVPRHPSLLHTVTANFRGFAQHELLSRKSLGYPPFVRMLRIVVSSAEKELPQPVLEQFRDNVKQLIQAQQLPITLLGPTPAPLQKLKTMWRWHLLLRSPSASALCKTMHVLQSLRLRSKRVRVIFDMDPQEMM